MLVHAPCRPGERIDEQPADRAALGISEIEGRRRRGDPRGAQQIPYVILRLAGVYDERTMVPTMAQQMARIYERDFQSYFYSGSTLSARPCSTGTTCSKRSAAPSTAATCCRPKPRS